MLLRRTLYAIALALMVLVPASTQAAGRRVVPARVVRRPVLVRPAPVVVALPPVLVQPAPVVVNPPSVLVQPAPVVVVPRHVHVRRHWYVR
jgi:hypothetical protein